MTAGKHGIGEAYDKDLDLTHKAWGLMSEASGKLAALRALNRNAEADALYESLQLTFRRFDRDVRKALEPYAEAQQAK